jgi:hypothetical protein
MFLCGIVVFEVCFVPQLYYAVNFEQIAFVFLLFSFNEPLLKSVILSITYSINLDSHM